MSGGIVIGILVVLLGVPFVLIWWKVADGWAEKEHRRFKEREPQGPAPTVIKRSEVEEGERPT